MVMPTPVLSVRRSRRTEERSGLQAVQEVSRSPRSPRSTRECSPRVVGLRDASFVAETIIEQREGKCFRCGQAGHFSCHCPGRASPAPSVASAPATPREYGGVPSAAVFAQRAMMPRQSEMTRPAPSGRVFAAQLEEPAEVEERNVVVVSASRARKMVSGACVAYLATVVEVYRETPTLRDVSVPTLGLHSARGVTGDRSMAVPVHILYRYTLDGCTGTLVTNFKPEPRVCIFVGFVPVHFPVYRYTLAESEQFELQGVFRYCSLLFNTPRPLGLLLSSDHREGKILDTFHVIRHEDLVLATDHLITCHCAHSHMLVRVAPYKPALRR
uniref:CCHC-type domain-containing protein n=1 Tax=Ananas comosus var. bracteatus TaxID=296719 RepID=A0A6V7QBV1_ANACO|nr:unnamed protein product [Ananas comosus var. bracteatus]